MHGIKHLVALSTLAVVAGLGGCATANTGNARISNSAVNGTSRNAGNLSINSSDHKATSPSSASGAGSSVANSPGTTSGGPKRSAKAVLTYIAHLDMRDTEHGVMDGFNHKSFAIGVTSDGGITWVKVPAPKNAPARQEEISFTPRVALLGNNTIVIAWGVNNKTGSKIIVDTAADDGQTWQAHDLSTGKYGGTVETLTGVGTSAVRLVTSAGSAMERTQHSLFQSSDSGTTWSRVSVDDGYVPAPFKETSAAIPEWGRNLQFTWQSPSDGWVAMDDNGMAPKSTMPVMKTSNGGATWHKVSMKMPKGYVYGKSYLKADAPAFNGSVGTLAVETWDYHQAVTTYRTTNDGKTWAEVGQVATHKPAVVSFADPAHGMLLNPSTGMLKTTANGGSSWETVRASGVLGLPAQSDRVIHLKMLSAKDAVCVVTALNGKTSFDDTSQMYRTTNGGKSWTVLPFG